MRVGRAALNKDQLYGFEAMRGQVQRLERALASADQWQSLVASFPEIARTSAELVQHEGLDAAQVSGEFVRLFQTYVCEWRRFMPHAD